MSLASIVSVPMRGFACSSFLFGDEDAAGLQQHIYWGVVLLVIVFHGPGKLSLDHLLASRYS